MQGFETMPKKWGNSLGVTIPKEIVDSERLSPGKKVKVFVVADQSDKLRRIFGTLKLKMPTQKAMGEVDKEYHE